MFVIILFLYSMFLFIQGEALRQSLLTRYYGKDHPRARRESTMNPPVQLVHSAHGISPGSIMLSRAEMTLHDVQVSTHNM